MEQLTTLLSEYGLWIVFFGMIIEGTAVIILSGVLCHLGILPCEETLIVAILGAIVGDQMWFYIGKNYAHKVLLKFPLLKEKVDTLKDRANTKAKWLAMTSRFIYGGAIAFPLVLGVERYSHKKFTIFDAFGASLASATGLLIGYLLSSSLENATTQINKIEHFMLLFLIILIVLAIYSYSKKLKEKKIKNIDDRQ